jgi:hypothetical protein
LGKQSAEYYQRKSVQAAAERVLAQSWGGPVRLGELQGIWVYPDVWRVTVQRSQVLEGPSGRPATVIVKRINWPDVYDPDDVWPSGARGLSGQPSDGGEPPQPDLTPPCGHPSPRQIRVEKG